MPAFVSVVLGPVAMQILGDMGADAIKIELPGGDPTRPLGPARHPWMGAYFLNINIAKDRGTTTTERELSLFHHYSMSSF